MEYVMGLTTSCGFVFKLQVKYIITTVGANALVDLNPTKYNIKWTFAQWVIQHTANRTWCVNNRL